MGEMKWNPHYPDPQGMIDKLHEEHFHLMVSVWPFFRPGTSVYDQFDKNGWFIAKTLTGWISSRRAGSLRSDESRWHAIKYWNNINTALFQKGVDAWWLDTDEPETEGSEDNILVDHQLHIGSGARYANVYPLFHTEGVSEGQQKASDKKRVFILSRSAYTGTQRLGSDGLVGRRAQRLGYVCAADSGRAELSRSPACRTGRLTSAGLSRAEI